MNVLQIMRQANFGVDTIRAGNVLSGMWTVEEQLQAVNVAMDRTARLLRLSGSEILTKSMKSTDAGTDLISEIYSPTASLRITADVDEYTLPPDFVRVASIHPLVTTPGFEGVRFRPSSYTDDSWNDLRTIPSADLGSTAYFGASYSYIIQGRRTMKISPTPKDTFDIELNYHYKAPRLRYYSTGTIQRVNGFVGMTGTGTQWITYGLRSPSELIAGTIATPASVIMDEYYPTNIIFITDTSLNLAKPATVTDGVGIPYTIAMVPILPEEHHTWLAQMVAATMLRKVDVDLSMKMQVDLAQQLLEAVLPEVTLRQMQESLIGQAFELWR